MTPPHVIQIRHDSFVENVIVATLQIVGVAVAMTIIDRLGRRSLLFFSSILMALSQVGLGKDVDKVHEYAVRLNER